MSKHKNIVPCLLWVKQGGAKPKPDKITLDKEELKKLIEKTQDDLDDWEDASDASDDDADGAAAPVVNAATAKKKEEEEFTSAVRKAKKMADSIKQKSKKDKKRKAGDEDEEEDIVDKYGLDDYDDDESPMDFLHGMGGLTPFANDDEDPYITLKNEVDSDDEDFVLKPTDNLIALGRLTEEAACLEVHVYNAEQGNLFIHHDYILPTFPLVLEWLDYDVADGEKGNFCAMGTMEPSISLWDLDVVDSLEPVAVLAGARPMKKKKNKIKMQKVETLDNGHTDAVLDLAWNKNVRNVLASASADMTVRLWDLSQGKSVSTLSHHTMPVQCISWHPVETQSLLTGSFDNTAAVIDCRSPLENVKKWTLEGEVERALWDPFSPFQFLASTDKGNVYCVDIRQEKPIFTLSAHEQAATGVALSSAIPGLLVTTSPDKCMKVWDIQDGKPTLVLKRNLHMETLHCVSCNPDEPFVFAVGGDKDFKVWDIRESAAVRRHFLSRMPQKLAAECDGDEGDLPHVEEAMGGLNMGDDEDAKEEAEMIGGDRPETSGEKKKKPKKKKPKKKPKEPLLVLE